MKSGDCFWGDPTGGTNKHLWLVLNEPNLAKGEAALLNFSTTGDKPVKYSVPAGYHPDLTHTSTICYGDMIIQDDAWIEGEIKYGTFVKTSSLEAWKVSALKSQAETIGFIAREIVKLLKRS